MLSTTADLPARRTPAAAPDGSRDRVVAAARREFAAHGFAGASVDRIAAAARLNKAMIYYHFRSKAALYREILRDMFGAAGARIRQVAASALSPEEKVRQFIGAIATEAEARPHFPPIWFREIADGGKHLDDETLVEITGIVRALAGFIAEGVPPRRVQTHRSPPRPCRHRRAAAAVLRERAAARPDGRGRPQCDAIPRSRCRRRAHRERHPRDSPRADGSEGAGDREVTKVRLKPDATKPG